MNKLIFLVIVLFLSSCSMLSPVNQEPPNTYIINTLPSKAIKGRPTDKTILVLLPETRPIFSTRQIAFTSKPYQIGYYGLNQWAETPSQMLQPLIIQSLQNSHHFRAVVAPPYVGRYDYLLATQIVQLQQNYIQHPASVEFTVRVQLTKAHTGQLIKSQQYDVKVPILYKPPFGGIIATNRAAALILSKLTIFCLENT